MRRYVIVLALGAAVALITAACGGGEKPTATPVPATPTPRPAATATAVPATLAPASAATPTTAPATATPRPTATVAPATPTSRPAATATPAPPQVKYGGVLNTHWFNDYRNWDSWHAAGGASPGFTKSLMSNLVQFEPGTFRITEDLATSWQGSGDGKTYTFNLRKDAQWHDGKPVTSRDILYTFNRGKDPRFTFNSTRVQPIAGMEAPDEFTFKVTLKDLSNSFLPGVATPLMLIYPSHVPDITQWQKAPFGSGSFTLKADKPNIAYEFVRNPKYYRKDAGGRALPYLDGVTYHVIVEPALAVSAFRAGRIDCGCIFSQNWTNINVETLRREIPNLGEAGAVGGVRALQYNLKRAPFNNAAFRQAIGIGLDKEAIAATYEGGKLNYRPAPPLVPPELGGQWGLTKEEMEKTPGWFPVPAQNMAAARQKLQESGIDPKSVEVKVLGGGFYASLTEHYASAIQSDFGVRVNIVPLSTPESIQALQRGDFDLYLIAESQTIDDPSDKFSNKVTVGASQNYGGYSNTRVDRLLLDQDKEFDVAKRRQMLQEVQRILIVEHPITSLFFIKNMRVWYPFVKNYRAGPLHIQNFDFSEVWLDK